MTLFKLGADKHDDGDDYLAEFRDVIAAPQWPVVWGPTVELNAIEGTYGASLDRLTRDATH